jgi:hypothetical protein
VESTRARRLVIALGGSMALFALLPMVSAGAAAGDRTAAGADWDQPPSRVTGRYMVVPGHDDIPGLGRIVRYQVEVEGGLGVQPGEFASAVHRILNDPLGWGHGGRTIRFVRVDRGPVDVRVSLSSPAFTDRQCAPLRTYGKVSCFNRRRAVINSDRWLHGSPTYGEHLADYRTYVISHEVGHSLGHQHVHCPQRGAPAPVMMQQTKSLEGCRPNWLPYGGGPATARG